MNFNKSGLMIKGNLEKSSCGSLLIMQTCGCVEFLLWFTLRWENLLFGSFPVYSSNIYRLDWALGLRLSCTDLGHLSIVTWVALQHSGDSRVTIQETNRGSDRHSEVLLMYILLVTQVGSVQLGEAKQRVKF